MPKVNKVPEVEKEKTAVRANPRKTEEQRARSREQEDGRQHEE